MMEPTNPTSSTTPNPDGSGSNDPVTVIGAGVLGLTTCHVLQSRFPTRRITLLAATLPSTDPFPSSSSSSALPSSSSSSSLLSSSKALPPFASEQYPPSYASAWAGAHYRPIAPSTPQLHLEFELATHTYNVMKKIATETPEVGVKFMQSIEYLDRPGEAELGMRDGDVYAGEGDGFRVLGREELEGMVGVKWGCEYEAYCVNVPVYCAWLLREFERKGGRVVRRKLGGLGRAFDVVDEMGGGGEVPTVVNCSGTNFGEDAKMKIVRGQTVLVGNEYHRTVTRQYADGRWATLIPRPYGGGTIVGVSKEIDDDEEEARVETRQLLLEQAVECFPDFVRKVDDFEVIRDNVGRRPFREGGLRMEVEEVDGGRKRIVHGYGAGGRGYELSWAIAERLVEMVSPGHQRNLSP